MNATSLSSPRTLVARSLAAAGALLLLAIAPGCSFDSSGTPASCEQEGARQNGFVCTDGVWEVDEDGSTIADASGDDTMDASDTDDADEDIAPDGCEPRPEREYCDDRGMPCRSIDVEDDCLGRITIDCSAYINLDESLEHCGECDNLCTGGQNASPVCTEGDCDLTCDSGWIDANDDANDGCEVECTPTNGGVEVCDDQDNDCDGTVDEADAEDAETYYADADDDGYGDPSVSQSACDQPDGFVDNDDDCDDANPNVNPDATELCDGTTDDNCDGTVDENCPCTAGDTRDCGTDVGVCEFGEQDCNESGTWGACDGGQGDSAEVCDGLDNDCDGQTDEDFPTRGDNCSDGTGACEVTGQLVCNAAGDDVECDATASAPSNELCDGIDNDCDGVIDNGFGEKGDTCTVGTGACESTGTYVCKADGSGTICDATEGSPSTETCGNDIDDDCDGDVDEGCACDFDGTSEGVCSNGIPDGSGGCDEPTKYESDEGSCDGLDNDCDGVVDEGCQCDFDNTSTGVCSDGLIDDQGFCAPPGSYAAPESICDDLDNDCDGVVDEGCDDDGDGYCDADLTVIGSPAVCPNSAPDTADDCDDTSDVTYPGAAENESSTSCRRDLDQDGYGDENPPSGVTAGEDCDDGDPYTYDGAPEICDDKDNDCNGVEFDGSSSEANTFCQQFSNEGVRCYGTTACCELNNDGDLGCDFETRCWDGADNDNDGATDCADPDCESLSCGDGKVCRSGSCEFI
ncbi:MAG: putative metal-binding motif-containing protein [Myxococcota bacterium]